MFTKIESFRFADPDETVDNFYHMAQSDILPMSGENLGYTDGSVNLGNTATVWNNLYATSITASITINTYKLFADVETAGTSTAITVNSLTPTSKSYDIYFYAEGLILSTGALYLGIGFTTAAQEICRLDFSRNQTAGAEYGHERTTTDGILVKRSSDPSQKNYLFSCITLRKTSAAGVVSLDARTSVFSSATSYNIRYDYSACFCDADSTNSFHFYVTTTSNFYNSKILIYESD